MSRILILFPDVRHRYDVFLELANPYLARIALELVVKYREGENKKKKRNKTKQKQRGISTNVRSNDARSGKPSQRQHELRIGPGRACPSARWVTCQIAYIPPNTRSTEQVYLGCHVGQPVRHPSVSCFLHPRRKYPDRTLPGAEGEEFLAFSLSLLALPLLSIALLKDLHGQPYLCPRMLCPPSLPLSLASIGSTPLPEREKKGSLFFCTLARERG